MEILFISFSVINKGMRSVAMLESLADAGYRIDLISPSAIHFSHANICRLVGDNRKTINRFQLRWLVIRTLFKKQYDVVHCFDSAALCVFPLFRNKHTRRVYDAVRRVQGNGRGDEPLLWRIFPKLFKRRERSVVRNAEMVLSACSAMTIDLQGINKGRQIVQVEDVPKQFLFSLESPSDDCFQLFGAKPSALIVCRCLAGVDGHCRKILIAARKVLDMDSSVAFVFRGLSVKKGESMARHLDIMDRCIFLPEDETEIYLSWLRMADVAFYVPPENNRYVHSAIYSLLYSGAAVVSVSHKACSELLTETNSIAVLNNAESMAEGLIQAVREPLFSRALAVEARRLMVDQYSFSSFKHKVRMAYRELESLGR